MRFESRTYTILDNGKMRKQFELDKSDNWSLPLLALNSFQHVKLELAVVIHYFHLWVRTSLELVLDQKETNVKTSNEYHIIINIYTQPVRS